MFGSVGRSNSDEQDARAEEEYIDVVDMAPMPNIQRLGDPSQEPTTSKKGPSRSGKRPGWQEERRERG